MKDFKEKINSSIETKNSTDYKNKYESCQTNIQMSPHVMSYNQLFSHFSIILNFFSDYKKYLNELNEIKESKNNDIQKEVKDNKSKTVEKESKFKEQNKSDKREKENEFTKKKSKKY